MEEYSTRIRQLIARGSFSRLLDVVGAVLVVAITSCSGGPSSPSTNNITVTGVTPSSGSTFGGTEIAVVGASFAQGATVSIGGIAATNVVVVSSTSLTAVTAPRAAGAADVIVSVGGQSATLRSAFIYVSPSPVTNSPPVITSLSAQGTRPHQPEAFADLNEQIVVTASVEDAESSLESLAFEWNAAGGTFEGTGATVQWRAPQIFSAPGTILLSVTVIERYTEANSNGLPIQREHRVKSGITVKVHDSAREVADMARNFLELFSDSSVPPETVVQDFLSGCGDRGMGRENELRDTINNRKNFIITGSSLGEPQVTVDFGGQCTLFPERFRPSDACALVAVVWNDTEIASGTPGITTGTDQVTAIYNGTRWGLCDSDFKGSILTATGQVLPGSLFKR